MHPTQTGIAVALALVIVVLFYVLGGFTYFAPNYGGPASAAEVSFTTDNEETMEEVTELQVRDDVPGSGQTAETGDTVTVQYVGMLTTGTVFDASRNHGPDGLSFTLGAGQVIQGWDRGILGMKEGGKRRLIIPADLAYGSQAVGDVIPANSTLIFDVELVAVQKAQ